MADRLYCALNGTTLRDLDARIHLLDVEELAPAVRMVTASRIGGGLHLLRRQREQLSLRVRFLIEEYDIAARHQLLHLVAAWAEAGGVLTLHEDGKRVLRVVCTQYPTMSTLNWLETLSLVFTAFSCPYWEDAAETSSFNSAGDSAVSTPSSVSRPTLRTGSRGDSVRLLQTLLNRAGYELAVDGIFGTMTRCSVKGFQSERGLAVDGIVGKQTWAALEGGGA